LRARRRISRRLRDLGVFQPADTRARRPPSRRPWLPRRNAGLDRLLIFYSARLTARRSTPAFTEPFPWLSSSNGVLTSSLLERQLFVDDAFEYIERLRAAEQASVDEERGSGRHAGVVARSNVGVDLRGVLARIEAAVEACAVEPQLGCSLLEIAIRQFCWIREQPIVERPELVLFRRAFSRFCGGAGVRVIGERIVAIHEANPIAVRVEQLVDRRVRLQAEGALKIREFDQLDPRAGPYFRRAARRRDDLPGRIEQDANGRFPL